MSSVRRRTVNITLQMSESSELAAAALAKQSLYLPPKPADEIPRLSDVDDVTELSDEQLMYLFLRFTSWTSYLAAQLACAEVDERAAQNILDVAEATALVRDWGGSSKDRVTVAKADRLIDPDVQEKKQTLAERYAFRKLTSVLHDNLDREASALSREITRRTSGPDPKTRRTERYSR